MNKIVETPKFNDVQVTQILDNLVFYGISKKFKHKANLRADRIYKGYKYPSLL